MKTIFHILAATLISTPVMGWTSPSEASGDADTCRAALIRLVVGARQAAFAKSDVANKAREIAELKDSIERARVQLPFDQDILNVQRQTLAVNTKTLEILKSTQASRESEIELLVSLAEGKCLIEGMKYAPPKR